MPKDQSNLDAMRELAEGYELKFHHDYSGRGMYGRTCIGVEGTRENFWRFTLVMASELHEDLMIALETLPQQDSMGMDLIWYWPGVTIDNIDA